MEEDRIRSYNSDNDAVHTQVVYFGRPDRVKQIVIGDSHITRIAAMNMTRYRGFEEAAKGLVLIQTSGGMVKLRSYAKQFVRGLYQEYQTSFDDESNDIKIVIALGYNDVEKKIEEYFNAALDVIGVFKHVLHKVPADWSVHLAEVPYGKSMYHSMTAQINFVACQLNRLLGPHVPLRLWTAQVGLDLPENKLKPVNCQFVSIMVERCMLDPEDRKGWHNKPSIMEETRDVIFDWARGIARATHSYPLNNTYPNLVEFEISIRGRTVVANHDYFHERQEKLLNAFDSPRDPVAMRDCAAMTLPYMKLGDLRDKLIPRPQDDGDDDDVRSQRSGSGGVRDRLGSYHRGGRGGGHGGHGGARGGGHGGRGGEHRPAPYKYNHKRRK